MSIEHGPEIGPERGPEAGRRIEMGPEWGGSGDRDDRGPEIGEQLVALVAHSDALIEDFTGIARRLTGDTSLSKSVRGMLWLGRYYLTNSAVGGLRSMYDGYERYQAEIDETPTDIIVPSRETTDLETSPTRPGILVGLVGAGRTDRGDPFFQGVVAMGERGEDMLAPVVIRSDGKIMLHPDYLSGEPPKTLRESYERITKIYPPSPTRR